MGSINCPVEKKWITSSSFFVDESGRFLLEQTSNRETPVANSLDIAYYIDIQQASSLKTNCLSLWWAVTIFSAVAVNLIKLGSYLLPLVTHKVYSNKIPR